MRAGHALTARPKRVRGGSLPPVKNETTLPLERVAPFSSPLRLTGRILGAKMFLQKAATWVAISLFFRFARPCPSSA